MTRASRRDFILSTAAFASLPSFRGFAADEPELRFGVLADIHVADEKQLADLEKALRQFDEWKCDAVLCCGDLADYGIRQQLKLVAEAWFRVFPDGKGADGREVVNLFHYGDHDMSVNYIKRPEAVRLTAGSTPEDSLLFLGNNRKTAWEDCFRESFRPITVKVVKGYPFVLYHFNRGVCGNPRGDDVPGLEEVLAKLQADPSKPIFFSQHRSPRGTHFDAAEWGQDNGGTTALFSRIPNLVSFTGHLHRSAYDERSVWQGGFTSILVPSLRYNTTGAGRENSYNLTDRPPKPPFRTMGEIHATARQGLFCTVSAGAITIRRWNFTASRPLGPDWTIPFSSFSLDASSRPFAFANRAKGFPIPQFAADAAVTLSWTKGTDRGKQEHEMLAVEFPPAASANDYEIRIEAKRRENAGKVLAKRVYGAHYYTGGGDPSERVRCLFSREELPRGVELRVVVRPLNAFGGAGREIRSFWGVC